MHCLGQVQVDDAGLDHGKQVVGLDVEDLLHPGGIDDDNGAVGCGAAGKPGTGTAGKEGHVRAVQQPYYGLYFCGRLGEHDGTRRLPVHGEPITLIGDQRSLGDQCTFGPQHLHQLAAQVVHVMEHTGCCRHDPPDARGGECR